MKNLMINLEVQHLSTELGRNDLIFALTKNNFRQVLLTPSLMFVYWVLCLLELWIEP
jgi:hypothetical protein